MSFDKVKAAVGPYWKAVIGFVAPGFLVIASAVLPDTAGGTDIVASEWITAVASAILTSAGVYTVRNRPMPEKNQPPLEKPYV